MKICIYGAGAIGGLIGAKLARAGQEVSVVARGAQLEAIRDRGLTIQGADETFTVHPAASADPADLGPQDVVIVAVKAHQVPAIAAGLGPLFGPETAVVMAVNGVPWWYFHGVEGPLAGRRLTSVDPDGRQWDLIGPERVIGCVVYPAAEIVAPGTILHVSGDRLTLGEPDGSMSPRARAISGALIAAGLKAPVKPNIRTEIWVKLWGNAVFNPISALTGATLKAICEDPFTRALSVRCMEEVERVALALGTKMPIPLEKRLEGAAAVGEHKTSMLQDIGAGKPLELDAIVGAVIELASITSVAVPQLESLYALTRLKSLAV